MSKFIFDKLYNKTAHYKEEDRSTIVVSLLLVIVHIILDLSLIIVTTILHYPYIALFNAVSILIGLVNILIFTKTKHKNIGITLLILNTIMYVGYSTYIIGYDQNATVLLPLMILVTLTLYKTKSKFILLNIFFIFIMFIFNIYVKYNIEPMYTDISEYAGYINNTVALIGTLWFITTYYKIESYAKELTKDTKETTTIKKDTKVKDIPVESNIDSLTGLNNKRYMEEFLKNNSTHLSGFLVMGDIDYLKKVNDNYGNSCGDYILKELSKIFKSSFGKDDYVCRWSGEEFLMYIDENDSSAISKKLNSIRKKIEDTKFTFNSFELKVTITLGYYKLNNEYNISKNIRNASIALYYGKSSGRNKVIDFDETINK